MELELIKTDNQYQEYLNWVDQMFDAKLKPDSHDGEKLQKALLLIKQYEDSKYPIPEMDISL